MKELVNIMLMLFESMYITHMKVPITFGGGGTKKERKKNNKNEMNETCRFG